MVICASDGRTYKSKCAIKRQQCLKQYEIGLIYPGVCSGKYRPSLVDNHMSASDLLATDDLTADYSPLEDGFLPPDVETVFDYAPALVPIDSSETYSP